MFYCSRLGETCIVAPSFRKCDVITGKEDDFTIYTIPNSTKVSPDPI